VMVPGETSFSALADRFVPMTEHGRKEVIAEGVPDTDVTDHCELDMRYRGQAYELTVPFTEEFVAAFHEAHHERYGHAEGSAPVEIVNLRLRVVGATPVPPLPRRVVHDDAVEVPLVGVRTVVVDEGEILEVELYDGDRMGAENELVGPAVIAQKDTTIYLSRGDVARSDAFRNVMIEIGAK